jgi:hypothetical protein
MINAFTYIMYSVTRAHAYHVPKYYWKKIEIDHCKCFCILAHCITCDARDTICS